MVMTFAEIEYAAVPSMASRTAISSSPVSSMQPFLVSPIGPNVIVLWARSAV